MVCRFQARAPGVIRLWLGIILAVVLLAGGGWSVATAYRSGQEAGRAVVMAKWTQDAAQRADALRRAQAASDEALRQAFAKREEVTRELEARLAGADARGRDLAARLRLYAQARAIADLPRPGAPARPADAASGKPGDQAAVGAAFASHLAACERDAQRLTELQAFISQ